MLTLKILFVLRFLVFTSTVGAQISFSSMSCRERGPKIVGGFETMRNEMPYIVSLTRRGGHFCGATIINEKWVLTAGHCLCNGLNRFMKASQIQGVMGLHSISQYLNAIRDERDDDVTQPLQVNFKNLLPHPKYQCTLPENDIALLELIQPLTFSHHIQPTCLMTDVHFRNNENELATVSGWGWTNENQYEGERADALRKALVRVWSNNLCKQSYQANGRPNSEILDTQLCAGFENGGIDSCWADSGGPLMSKENYLIGIVSTGVGCARPGLPGIYTRVSKYLNWLKSVIDNE
uniref:Peptidase S1 domain-containing protein n=1 Tax=Glossina brevipalpis TaxID=37001 RepID=A0A1A9WGH0_9MUSC